MYDKLEAIYEVEKFAPWFSYTRMGTSIIRMTKALDKAYRREMGEPDAYDGTGPLTWEMLEVEANTETPDRDVISAMLEISSAPDDIKSLFCTPDDALWRRNVYDYWDCLSLMFSCATCDERCIVMWARCISDVYGMDMLDVMEQMTERVELLDGNEELSLKETAVHVMRGVEPSTHCKEFLQRLGVYRYVETTEDLMDYLIWENNYFAHRYLSMLPMFQHVDQIGKEEAYQAAVEGFFGLIGYKPLHMTCAEYMEELKVFDKSFTFFPEGTKWKRAFCMLPRYCFEKGR